MAEQGTHKPLVPSSNLGVATGELVTSSPGGFVMVCQATRIITPVTWLAAPDWLTIQQACHLLGHDEGPMRWLIQDGDVETNACPNTSMPHPAGGVSSLQYLIEN